MNSGLGKCPKTGESYVANVLLTYKELAHLAAALGKTTAKEINGYAIEDYGESVDFTGGYDLFDELDEGVKEVTLFLQENKVNDNK